jgi:Mg/Co/Ni transporter MgtE
MAPDDAADMISEIDQERRAPILELLPEPQRRKVRSLLHYHPETAGGLMSPDFLELPGTTTVEEALEAIRVSTVPREALSVVFVSDPDDGHVIGSVPAVQLIQSPRHKSLSEVATTELGHVHPDWDLGGTVRKMSDFNLTEAPVLDPEHRRVLGVITVDDVLELLLPSGWRRDFGLTAAEE